MSAFVAMYNPALPGSPHVLAPVRAEALYAAHGWLAVDGTTPSPTDIYLTPGVGDLRYAKLGDIPTPATATGAALRAALVPFWTAAEAVTTGTVRMTADGHTIVRNSNGTTRSTYDGTEAALWTVVSGGGGTVSDATTGAKGIVQLAGDLAGTAAAPTVAKIGGSTPAAVATTGAYADLSGKPTIPATQTVQTIWTTNGALVVDSHNPVDASSAAKTMTLPTGQAQGTVVSVEKEDASANLVTITGNIRGTGSSSLALAWQYESVTFIADTAGSWWPRAGHKTKASLDAAYQGYVNIKSFGAKLDGTTDDQAAIAAAITSLGSRGGTVFVPPGISQVGSTITVPSNIRIVGAGKNASILRRTFNGVLLDFSGSSTSVRCQRGGAADLMLTGNQTTTGTLVQATYADHLNFDRVWFFGSNDSAFVGTELWDTYFQGCEFEWCGAGTDGLKPVVLLKSTATDSTNEIYFSHCRWESFRDSALVISTGGVTSAFTTATGSHPVYGVYLTDCKMESAFLRGPVINFSGDAADVHVDRLYLAADNVDTGIGSGRNLIEFVGLAACTFSKVHVFINNNSTARVFHLFPGQYGHAIRDVYVDAQTAPSTGVIDFAGGNPNMRIANVRFKTGQSGTLYSGTAPSNVILDDVPTVKSSTQTANYTLALADADSVVEMNAASGVATTVPPNSSVAFPIGTIIEVHQYGVGQVTVTAGAGVTLRTATSLTTRTQYSTVSVRKRATDEWIVVGDLT